MKIPTNFKILISQTFYDKTIYKCNLIDDVDNEGWAREYPVLNGASFVGNVNYKNLDQVQQDYGLSNEKVDLAVTTSENVIVGTVVQYSSLFYRITQTIICDTHNMLLLQKWLPKSTKYLSL